MRLDELTERVEEELGFPVTRQELVERFGHLEIEAPTEPLSLREYLEQRGDSDAPLEGSADAGQGSPNEFDSPKNLESYLW